MTPREQRLVDALEGLILATFRLTDVRAMDGNDAEWLEAVNGKLRALGYAQAVMAQIKETDA